jgi:hypothetical protein
VLLNDKEWHRANERNGTEVAHENLVGVDELLWGIVTDTCRDTDSDRIGHDYKSRTGDIDKVIELCERLALNKCRHYWCRALGECIKQ